MNRIRRLWWRFERWLTPFCPICLLSVGHDRDYCSQCAAAVNDVAWLRRLARYAEGGEERP